MIMGESKEAVVTVTKYDKVTSTETEFDSPGITLGEFAALPKIEPWEGGGGVRVSGTLEDGSFVAHFVPSNTALRWENSEVKYLVWVK
jgi:hypothetical protein